MLLAREKRLRDAIHASPPTLRRRLAEVYRESLEFGKFIGHTTRSVKVLVLCKLYNTPDATESKP